MNLILFGPPGSGKGTQAQFLEDLRDYYHISTGEILREATQNNTELGLKARHFMDEGLDTGDIVCQERIEIGLDETADELYQRVKRLELAIFKKAWPCLMSYKYERQKQKAKAGTMHCKKDIKTIQPIALNRHVKTEEVIRQLRALTTNDIREAAYFKINNKIFRVQIKIKKDKR